MNPNKTNSKSNSSKSFWNKEYQHSTHLAMSTAPSSDLQHFERWAVRNAEWPPFPEDGMILDIGCGNGRNLNYLCEKYKMKGLGFDISAAAIQQAEDVAKKQNLSVSYLAQSASESFTLPDESVDVALDMMVSHYLRKDERTALIKEIVRVMKPYGWLFFKTFVLEGDVHAKRLISEHPDQGTDGNGGEANSYIHPKIGVYEHVWSEDEIYEAFRPYFKIHKLIKSYKHFRDGRPYKRRTVSVYMERYRE